MNTNYQAPEIEVIEIELEGVLCTSDEDEYTFGATTPGATVGNR